MLDVAFDCEEKSASCVIFELAPYHHDYFSLSFGAWYTLVDWVKLFNDSKIACTKKFLIPILVVMEKDGNDMKTLSRNCEGNFEMHMTRNPSVPEPLQLTQPTVPTLSSKLTPLLIIDDVNVDAINCIVEVLGEPNSWKLDASALCELLVRAVKTNERLFPLALMIALQAQPKGNTSSILINFIEKMVKFVREYHWTDECIAFVRDNPPIEHAVTTHLRQLLPQNHNNLPIEMDKSLPIQLFLIEIFGDCREAKLNGFFESSILLASSRNNFSGFLTSLNTAIGIARERDPNCFSACNMKTVLLCGSRYTKTMEELLLLVNMCNMQESLDCTEVIVAQHVGEFVRKYGSSMPELIRIVATCKRMSPDYVPMCVDYATDHVLGLTSNPIAVMQWADYLEGNDLPAISSRTLLDYLKRSDVKQFDTFLRMFTMAVKTADDHDIGFMKEEFAIALKGFMARGSDMWLEIVRDINDPRVTPFVDTVMKVLKEILVQPKHILNLVEKIRYERLTEELKNAIEIIVVKVIDDAKMDSPCNGVFTVSNFQTSSDNDMLVMARLATRCAKRMKVLSHFSDISLLSQALQACTFPTNLFDAMFFGWLRVGVFVDNRVHRNQSCTAEDDFVKEVFDHFFNQCRVLFGESSINGASFGDINKLCGDQKRIVERLESLFNMDPAWSSALKFGCLEWQRFADYMKSHKTLLTSLPSYIPIVMIDINEVLAFLDASPGEQVTHSLSTVKSLKQQLEKFVSAMHPQSKHFFDHFVVNASPSAASKSVLFRTLLACNRQQQPDGQWVSVNDFSVSLSNVDLHLKRLLHIGEPELSFGELRELGKILGDEGRSPDSELLILDTYYTIKERVKREVQESLTVLALIGFVDPLKTVFGLQGGSSATQSVVGVLARYEFDCAVASEQDSYFAELVQLTKDICDEEVLSDWAISDSKRALSKLKDLLCPAIPDSTYEMALKMLGLFQNLGKAEKVWQFMHWHREFVGEGGYSASFNDTVEDFLSQLGGEDYKVLDNFKPVAQWVAILVQHQHSSFAELMTALCSTPSILEQVCQPMASRPFSQLSSAETNMDWVSNLFQKGLCALDAVVGQFNCISACCIYWFDLDQLQLRLSYHDDKKLYMVDWTESQVRDFEQRLGFVQCEEKVQHLDVEPFLDMLQRYRRQLTDMTDLRILGHQDWKKALIAFVHGEPSREWDASTKAQLSQSTVIQESDLLALSHTRDTWKQTLQKAYINFPILRLFSTSVAQQMNNMIKQRKSNNLALFICNLLLNSAESFIALMRVTADVLRSDTFVVEGMQWPEQVAVVLEEVLRQLELQTIVPVFKLLSKPSINSTGVALQLSSTSPQRESTKTANSYIPHTPTSSNEILWCQNATTANELTAFIERAYSHSYCRFTSTVCR